MELRNVQNNGTIIAAVSPVTPDDLKVIKESPEFGFDWVQFKNSEMYKLQRNDTGEILGVMAIQGSPFGGGYIEIEALETGKSNVGSGKKIDRIAGCLIAWCARQSFIRGYEGYIKVVSKSDLIQHYIDKYGMMQLGATQTVILDTSASHRLITEYLGDV